MVENEMLNLQNGSEERKMPNIYGWFVLSCHVSGFTFAIKQNTFVNVYQNLELII